MGSRILYAVDHAGRATTGLPVAVRVVETDGPDGTRWPVLALTMGKVAVDVRMSRRRSLELIATLAAAHGLDPFELARALVHEGVAP